MELLKALFGFKAWEFDLAMRYLRNRRKDGGIAIIAIISFIGIMAAVFVLITTMSVMNGFRGELMGRVLGFNGSAYIYGAPLSDLAHRDAMVARLKAVPGVTEATPYLDAPGLIEGPDGQQDLTYMRGVVPDALKANKLIRDNLENNGTMADFGTGDYGGNVVLVGDGLASTLDLRRGSQITLMSLGGSTAFGAAPKTKVYTVGAVFKSGVSEIDKAFVYLPLTQAQLFFGREDEWDAVEIKVKNPYDIARYRAPLKAAAGQGALYEDWTERNAPLWGALKMERTVMRFILSSIVVIAMLNIISGIVMLVKNKTRDVAILRTMGASRSAISRVFFIAGTTIGAVGTAAGMLLGVVFCAYIQPLQIFIDNTFHVTVFNKNVYYLDYLPARIEPAEVAFVVIGALLMACISTLFPALWASKLEPVEALRYE